MDTISLSPYSLFLHAGFVGKATMLLLACASLWCWALIIEMSVTLTQLSGLLKDTQTQQRSSALEELFRAGAESHETLIIDETVGERRSRISEAMHRAAAPLFFRLERGLPSLAVISSVAPFVGLFGTVWGIMTSFAAIGEAKDTSLAVVAPGIAEALAATAYGLAAAIPATFAYNRLGARLNAVRRKISFLIESKAVELLARA
jgi:biopolymer transport protein ExbB/TolQ